MTKTTLMLALALLASTSWLLAQTRIRQLLLVKTGQRVKRRSKAVCKNPMEATLLLPIPG
jgi:hypothetical protein